jgi:phospholipid/cholesterol/gamma-HCH transport system substrate-binding protein
MSRAARLGAFIIATLAILATGVFIIGSRKYLFQPTYELQAQFDNVAGLAAGADVQVGGVHSGTVQRIELPHHPGEQVKVIMNLDQTTHEIIKQDSVASIQTEGLLGNQFVSISFGGPGQPDVTNGETIHSQPPLIMAEMLQKASGMLDTSQQAIENATKATAHLNSVSAKIDSGQGTIGALINDKAMYNNLQQTTSTLNDTVAHAESGVTDFQENMEALKHNFFLSGYFKKRGYEDSSELAANRIGGIPEGAPAKTFSFPAKDLFNGRDSAKLKNEKTLKEAGQFLAANPFGVAIVVTSTGMEGDTQKDQTLTEARAMVVREYLVENFGFDDSLLKTLGEGKQSGDQGEWGTIKILIFPPGTPVPASAPGSGVSQSTTISTATPDKTGGTDTPGPKP